MAGNRSEHQPLLSIEGLRLIASLAIVFTHFAIYALPEEPFGGALTIFVDLFFVISGVVITTAYANRVDDLASYGSYMQRRFARLYPLHLATMLVFCVIAALAYAGVFQVRNPERYAVDQLPLYFTLTQAWFGNGQIAWNAVSWSISAELVAYIVFPVLLALLRGSAIRGAFIVLLIACTAAIMADFLTGQELTRLASKLSWLRAIPSFAAGVWLARHSQRVSSIGPAAAQCLLYGGAILLAAKLTLNLGEAVGLMSAWMTVSGAYSCDLQGKRTIPAMKIISDQGRLTYSIYLIHPVIATTWLSFLAPRMGILILNSMWVAIGLGIIMTFVLSHLSLVYFEEPLRQLLSKPISKSASKAAA